MAVSLIALVFLIPASLYVALSLPVVQKYICNSAEKELSEYLTVPVTIDHIAISPFNRVTIFGVDIKDRNGVSAMKVKRLGAGVNLWSLLTHDRIVVDYAEIIGMDATIYRDSIEAPLNIQPIIDAVSPKDKTKPPTRFDFRINTIVIRTSSAKYDVCSEPHNPEKFDPNHINIKGLRADIQLPQIKNDDFTIDLRRLAFAEQSGVNLTSLSGLLHISANELAAHNVELFLPNSHISFNDQVLKIDSLKNLKQQLSGSYFDVELKPGSNIAATDIVPFVPQLAGMDMGFDISLQASGTINHIELKDLELKSDLGARISAKATISNVANKDNLTVDVPLLEADINSAGAIATVLRFTKIDPKTEKILSNLGNVQLTASASADSHGGSLEADMTASGIDLILNGNFARVSGSPKSPYRISGDLLISQFDGSTLFAGIDNQLAELTELDGDITFDITTGNGLPDGNADLTIRSATFKSQNITDLTARLFKEGYEYIGQLFVDNASIYADADIRAYISPKEKTLDFRADLHDLSLFTLGIDKHDLGRKLTVNSEGNLRGTSLDDIAGTININDIHLAQPGHTDFRLDNISIESTRSADIDSISVNSEILDASIYGKYHLTTLIPVSKAILAQALPVVIGDAVKGNVAEFPERQNNLNDLTYKVNVKTLEPLKPLTKIPVGLLQPIEISGDFSSTTRSFDFRMDAPYLSQGNKLIQNTSLMADLVGSDEHSNYSHGHINFTTTIPTKKGPMTINTTAETRNDCIDSRLEWKIDRDRDFSGDISVTTCFTHTEEEDDNRLRTDVKINPSKAVFNDTVWTIDPADISIDGKNIDVKGFRCWRDKQFISMNGRVSELPSDTLTLTLEDVNLDYIFETLDIQTAMFGGNATGKIYATQLLTPTPVAYTDELNVKSLKYNHSLMGNALIKSKWVNDTKGIALNAEISQPNGRKSYIDGAIYPMGDSLNLAFDADRIEIGFLKPYMAAFASDVGGYASGKARLYGTFKLIDMTGDVYGEDVRLTIGFTNTTYLTTDSVHFRPGRIQIDSLQLKDVYGNKAMLNGWVTHECFKMPKFNFHITDARNLLVYDVKENSDFRWYGKIFGNGEARIEGRPGLVDIRVDMTTAPNSSFTYVLSDALSAQDYNFITFRDRDQAKKDSIAAINAPPLLVREFNERITKMNKNSSPSKYKMTFNIGISPQALITLVMDPVGGDRIRCHGSGTLAMSYDSANEDLRMNGTYILDDGKYNFTFQDIIIKEFTIKQGSSIAFNGDPYSAQLNLTAKYQVKANLTDLDESFLEDKELNRTNVPVDALLHVTGDMRQPEISFNLDFPTLTEETKRKVNSIVNTDEMMSRQIIYLLALSRFYTPDYMNATRGNELVSVASSTISSQLSNILGQLSDKWNIAPNFRSDRGDFSDMEFDVALSSNLLNNRLLLNGNLGYRDKSLNNNSFIGDFDIEYLLNRSGSLRLKAYNRYNDQNFYLKSALTTQGVGLVFKRDFDNMFSFLKPLFRKKKTTEEKTETKTDSIEADTIKQTQVSIPVEPTDFLQFK